MAEAHSNLNILRRKQVQLKTGLTRSTLYLLIAQGSFPKPIALSVRARGWLESEVEDWIQTQVRESRSSEAPSSRHSSHC